MLNSRCQMKPEGCLSMPGNTQTHTALHFLWPLSHIRAKKSEMNLHDSLLETSAPVFCCVDSVCCCLYVCLLSLLVDNIHSLLLLFCSSLVLFLSALHVPLSRFRLRPQPVAVTEPVSGRGRAARGGGGGGGGGGGPGRGGGEKGQ